MKRMGLLLPSSNTTMEREFSSLPHAVSLHTTRLALTEVGEDDLFSMAEDVERSALLLSDCLCDVIVYGCTSGSFVGGCDHSGEIEKKIESFSGIRGMTTSRAVKEALQFLEARSLFVFTPYTEDINEKERKFLEQSGFSVKGIVGLGMVRNARIGMLEEDFILGEILKTYVLSDCIFLSCTNMPTFGILEELEERFGVPCVSSNSATLFSVLRFFNEKSDRSIGRLLR